MKIAGPNNEIDAQTDEKKTKEAIEITFQRRQP